MAPSFKKGSEEAITAEFIDMVKKFDPLYNKKNDLFSDRDHKAQLWEKIGKSFSLSAQKAEEKWSSIRATWTRNRKKLEESSKSGAGATPKVDWVHWDQMSFLHGLIQTRNRTKKGASIVSSNFDFSQAENEENGLVDLEQEKEEDVDENMEYTANPDEDLGPLLSDLCGEGISKNEDGVYQSVVDPISSTPKMTPGRGKRFLDGLERKGEKTKRHKKDENAAENDLSIFSGLNGIFEGIGKRQEAVIEKLQNVSSTPEENTLAQNYSNIIKLLLMKLPDEVVISESSLIITQLQQKIKDLV